MKNFKLIKLKIKLKALEKIVIPEFAGSVFRGAFGHAFKKTACFSLNDNCKKCEHKTNCPYHEVFETEYPEKARSIKRIKNPPKPYIISPPAMNLTAFEEGKNFYFELTVIGKAINFLPYFIFTFKQMGKDGVGYNRGRFIVEDVQIFVDKKYKSIFSNDNNKIIDFNSEDLIQINTNDKYTEEINEIKLKFITPMNIIINKTSRHDMTFYSFFSRLVSRINALSLLYCGDEFIDEPLELINKAKNIKTAENSTSWYQYKKFSQKQNKSLVVGGYLGEITYCGNLSEFLTCLQIGEFVNNGKNITSGLGKYEIVKEQDDKNRRSRKTTL